MYDVNDYDYVENVKKCKQMWLCVPTLEIIACFIYRVNKLGA